MKEQTLKIVIETKECLELAETTSFLVDKQWKNYHQSEQLLIRSEKSELA